MILADGELAYDFLIVATGATHAYFGHDEWERFAPGLKTLKDALDIRRRVLLAFETAEREPDESSPPRWMTFVIVGAGPTGVELAGTLAEVARQTLGARLPPHRHVAGSRHPGRGVGPRAGHVRRSALGAGAGRNSSGSASRFGSVHPVSEITAAGVRVGADWIAARTVLWAAGVAASPLARSLEVPLDRAGRVLVEPDLTDPRPR